MTGLDLARKPTIEGEVVVLRPFREGDVVTMAEILSDPEVRALTGSVASTAEAHERHEPDERLRDWYATRNEQPDRLDLAIEDRASGQLVGEVVLNEVDADALTANLRILIGPEGRGRGAGTEAVGLVTAHAIEQVGLRRITLEVFDHNPRGRRVYDKVGYSPIGHREDALVFDGLSIGATDMAVDADSWRGWPPRG